MAATGEVGLDGIVPCFGGCCFISSCYTAYPDCLGAVCQNTILCISAKLIMCKPSKEDNAYCKCCLIDCDLVHIEYCVQSETQLFCLDLRASLPSSDKIPSMLTLFGWTCCYNKNLTCKCCANVQDIAASTAT